MLRYTQRECRTGVGIEAVLGIWEKKEGSSLRDRVSAAVFVIPGV